jgi:hypothetical protein
MPDVVLAVARLNQLTALPKDVVENGFAIQTGSPVTPAMIDQIALSINNFYDATPSGLAVSSISAFMSPIFSPAANAHVINFYNISAALGGGPHGGPIATRPLSLTHVDASSNPLPNQDAVVLSLRGSAYPAVLLVPGVAGAIPTDDFAQDEGAPATHPGVTRPAARDRGRLYIGPLNSTVVQKGASNEPRVSLDFRTVLKEAAKKLIVDLGVALFWSIWSRRNSGVDSVLTGFIDDRWDAQRRRESPPTGRLIWP